MTNSQQNQRDYPALFRNTGQAVINTETRAIQALSTRINDTFIAACQCMLNCNGRIVVTGMGKSGHIASKIAATLASTGSPSFFVHPAEANHGDMGMLSKQDVVLAISNSGETQEILTILPSIKRLGIKLIVMTGRLKSTMAQAADMVIDTSVDEEACPLGLAPTSSTTACLVMGDALAISLLQARGFTKDDFALYHPGGSLGKRLLLRIKDIMRTQARIPQISHQAGLDSALLEMTQKNLGMTAIINEDKQLMGVFTDGDLRRILNRGLDIHQTPITQVMTTNVKTAHEDMLAAEALQIMETHKITVLMIIDAKKRLIGVVHMHDLLSNGLS